MSRSLRCLLISANTVTSPYPVYPLGMAHIAGALHDAGHVVKQHDILIDGTGETLTDCLRDFAPDLIGVAIRNIDTVDSADLKTFLGDAINCVQTLRAQTYVPIVVGGSGFTIFPEKLMSVLEADYGIIGEGENAICQLAADIVAGQSPPSGTLLRGTVQASANWASVLYDPYIAAFYAKRGGMMNIQSKRGCPFRCSYCSYPLLEGRCYRYREPEEVADDVMRLQRDYGARYIFFADSVFNDAKGRYLEIAEALVRRKNKMPWAAYFRPKGLTVDSCDLLKRAGLHAIEFGTDATTDQTLHGMGKGFAMDDVYEAQRLTSAARIATSHFVIFGGPGETSSTVSEGIANMERLGDTVVFAFNGVRLLPNTPVYAQAVRDGVIASNQDVLPATFYFSPHVSQESISSQLVAAWQDNPKRVFPVSDSLAEVATLHEMGFVGPLWDKI